MVRTRTTISQAHSYQWLGSFGNRGSGRYREELRKGLAAIGRYLTAQQLAPSRTLLRLDGLYGTRAVLADLAGLMLVTRGKEYRVLDHPLVQARLHLPPDHFQQRRESQIVRPLYDCPAIPVGPDGVQCRVVVATHPATKKKSPVGITRRGVVYDLFFTNLPQHAFTAADVVEVDSALAVLLSLHSPMKPSNKTRTAGAATRPGGRKPGSASPNGSGISASKCPRVAQRGRSWRESAPRALSFPPCEEAEVHSAAELGRMRDDFREKEGLS